jgi:plastocyanin
VAIVRRLLGLAAAMVVAAALAACSPSGSAGAAATGSSRGTGGPGGAGGGAVATSVVDLPRSYRFAPEAISVPAGTTVTWNNNDNFSHSVLFVDGGLPTEPLLMQPGESATFTFAAPGTYSYVCHLHPQDMRGTVTVTP